MTRLTVTPKVLLFTVIAAVVLFIVASPFGHAKNRAAADFGNVVFTLFLLSMVVLIVLVVIYLIQVLLRSRRPAKP